MPFAERDIPFLLGKKASKVDNIFCYPAFLKEKTG